MVQTISRQAANISNVTDEDLYKLQIQRAVQKSGCDSLETGLALLELAELYDTNDKEHDSEPLWREIERILSNHVKTDRLKKATSS